MEEKQVTVAGKTRKMPDLFMVLATQNPIEQEGTYPLPEAQMDRFLMHVKMDYPSDDQELDILRLVRGEEVRTEEEKSFGSVEQASVFQARDQLRSIHISENMERYIVSIISATRNPGRYSKDLERWIEVGASPRGSLALDKVSRAHAWLENREMVTPDNIRAVAHDCLRHRLIFTYEASAEGISPDRVIDEILTQVATV
jgi:MoxR-like ATPase